MSFLLLNIFLAALPSLAILYYFYRRDRYKREPAGLLLKTFLIGFLAVLPAALIELVIESLPLFTAPLPRAFFRAFVVAALVEEVVKLKAVKSTVFTRPEFNEYSDGIIYTVAASLGFAFFENIFYSFGPPAVLLTRGFTSVPLHASASGVMGYYLGRARFAEPGAEKKGLFFAILIHGFYDLFLFLGGWLSVLVIPVLALSIMRLLQLWNRAVRDDRKRRIR
jgi:RsiW-degrading membrane proteinase PrsW (M82 family)